MRKICTIICLILWSISFCISVIDIVQGVTVNPIQAALPAIVCVIKYAEDLFKE